MELFTVFQPSVLLQTRKQSFFVVATTTAKKKKTGDKKKRIHFFFRPRTFGRLFSYSVHSLSAVHDHRLALAGPSRVLRSFFRQFFGSI